MNELIRSRRLLLLLFGASLLGAAAFLAGAVQESPKLRLAATAIVAEDFDGMLRFYRDTLGFEIETYDTEGQHVQFRGGDVTLQLMAQQTMERASGRDLFSEVRSGSSFELAFEVDSALSVDRMYERILAGGGTAIAAPADKPWGQRIAFFADPDGNIHDVFAMLP